MAVGKFSISLPEELLASLDELAASDGVTRSALIREVTTEYVVRRRTGEYERERAARIQRAMDGFERIAGAWGPDERAAAELVREIRRESLGDD